MLLRRWRKEITDEREVAVCVQPLTTLPFFLIPGSGGVPPTWALPQSHALRGPVIQPADRFPATLAVSPPSLTAKISNQVQVRRLEVTVGLRNCSVVDFRRAASLRGSKIVTLREWMLLGKKNCCIAALTSGLRTSPARTGRSGSVCRQGAAHN